MKHTEMYSMRMICDGLLVSGQPLNQIAPPPANTPIPKSGSVNYENCGWGALISGQGVKRLAKPIRIAGRKHCSM